MGPERSVGAHRSFRGVQRAFRIDESLEPKAEATVCRPYQDLGVVPSPSRQSTDASGIPRI